MSACIAEPISWLRLERYRLQELAVADAREIEQHLAACASCRECLAKVDAPLPLPELPVRVPAPIRRPVWGRARFVAAASAITAAAAAAVLMLRSSPGLEPPRRVLAIKGGELAIGLVRERAGAIAREPSQFAPGDRFKVLLTCPPPLRPHVDVVVFQGEQAFFPLQPAELAACGNALALPGAFALDGAEDALVCAVVSDAGPVDRAALSAGGVAALPALSVCAPIAPAPR
jgi:hypothetical protein